MHKIISYWIIFILCLTSIYAWSTDFDTAEYYRLDNELIGNISDNSLTNTGLSFSTNAKPQGFDNYSAVCDNSNVLSNLTFGSPDFNLSHVMTINVWINVTAGAGDDTYVWLGAAYPNGLWLARNGGNAFFIRNYNGGVIYDITPTVPAYNNWFMVTVTLNGSTGDGVMVYINNAIAGNHSSQIGMLPTWDDLYVCGNPVLGDSQGHIDNLYLDSVKWTADNVTTAYENGLATNYNPEPSIPIDTGIMNITLDAPNTGVTNTSLSQNFSYLPIGWNEDFVNCSLLVNSTGVWAYNLTDDSVTNNSYNKFSDVEFQENQQSGTDVLWNIECEDASGDINSTSVNWTIHFEEHLNISNIYLVSPTPDQTLWIGDIGNTTDTTPTFNQTTTKDATCFIGTDNASWTICSTTNAIGSICTIGSALETGLQSIYFTCNSTLTNIDYAERLISVFSVPSVNTPLPTNNSLITTTSTLVFNATIIDYTNLTLSCNLSNGSEVIQTNSSVDNNSVVKFYQTLDNQNDYSWNITCSNGYYEGTSGYMNLSINYNATQEKLCSYIQRVEFYPNVTYYNWSTGHLTQYGVLAENTTRCGFTWNLTIGNSGDLQVSTNINFNETFVLKYRGIVVNTSWATIDNVTSGSYYLNATSDYVNATGDSSAFETYMRVI